MVRICEGPGDRRRRILVTSSTLSDRRGRRIDDYNERMPWWFWILLWTVLVLVSAAIFGWLAWRTVQRFFGALEDVGSLGEDMTNRWETSASSVATGIREAPVPGILVPIHRAREEYLRERSTRHQRKAAQRIARRDRLGQPQNFRDMMRGDKKGRTHAR